MIGSLRSVAEGKKITSAIAGHLIRIWNWHEAGALGQGADGKSGINGPIARGGRAGEGQKRLHFFHLALGRLNGILFLIARAMK
jgi:hypothetical protein